MHLRIYRLFHLIFGFCAPLCLSGCGVVQPHVDFTQILTNLSNHSESIFRITTGFAYCMGIIFVFLAIGQFRHVAERGLSHGGQGFKMPMAYLLVGSGLIYSPQLYKIMNDTLYKGIIEYRISDTSIFNASVIYKVLSVFGVISFVRGWMQLISVAKQSQHVTFAKAFMHIVGGVAAINAPVTMSIFNSLFFG